MKRKHKLARQPFICFVVVPKTVPSENTKQHGRENANLMFPQPITKIVYLFNEFHYVVYLMFG